MKTILRIFIIFFVLFFAGNLFAADDEDLPYLSEDDINAIETYIPDELTGFLQEMTASGAIEEAGQGEIDRLNASHRIFHLLILDRAACALNSDISGISNSEILYKYRHNANGYLIAIYTSPQDGPVFPRMPSGSRILVNLTTVRINTLLEYVNSNSFRRFVTNSKIHSEIKAVLEAN